MSTPIFSKLMDFTLDGSLIACAQDFSLSVSKDMIEIACMNSTDRAKQNIPDMYGYTVSGSGLVFRTSDAVSTEIGIASMMSNLINTDASVAWTITPDVASNDYFTGVGYFSSISQEGGLGAPVSYSFELAGDGPIVIKQTSA